MIISLSEFAELSSRDKKNTLSDLKSDIGVSGIVEAWGISRSKVYNMLKELDIPRNSKTGSKARSIKTTKKAKHQESENTPVDQKTAASENNLSSSKAGKNGSRKGKRLAPYAPGLTSEEVYSKFSLHMDTEGNALYISDTLQNILASAKLSNANLHVNVTLEEL